MPKYGYNSETGHVTLPPDATAYDEHHEWAHADQHVEGALCFKAWQAGRRIVGIAYLVTLWVEWDAYRRAREWMIATHVWTPAVKKEARQKLFSYAKRKELDG